MDNTAPVGALPPFLTVQAVSWHKLVGEFPDYGRLWREGWADGGPFASISPDSWLGALTALGNFANRATEEWRAIEWQRVPASDLVGLFAAWFMCRLGVLRMVPASEGDLDRRTRLFLLTGVAGGLYLSRSGQIDPGRVIDGAASNVVALLSGPPAWDEINRRGRQEHSSAGLAAAFVRFWMELRRADLFVTDDSAETWAINRLHRGAQGALPSTIPFHRRAELLGQIPIAIEARFGKKDPLDAMREALEGRTLNIAPLAIAHSLVDALDKVITWERRTAVADDQETITVRIRESPDIAPSPETVYIEKQETKRVGGLSDELEFNEYRQLLQEYASLGPKEAEHARVLTDQRSIVEQAAAAGLTVSAIRKRHSTAGKAVRAWRDRNRQR